MVLFMGGDKEVLLHGSDLDALSSSTRRELLKALGERRKTASELSLERKTSVQGVSEQLGKLEKSGLVKRAVNGKWVYYELTEKSAGLVGQSVPKKFFILLSTAFLALFTGFYRFLATQSAGSPLASSVAEPIRSTSKDLVAGAGNAVSPAQDSLVASVQQGVAGAPVNEIASKAVSQTSVAAAGVGREFAFSAVELLLIAVGAFLLAWALYAAVRKK
ncbi:winged helix-turn-helix transcriptional regulator [Candidatus Micrarchaeota archaeon]|nr:winged helix-turn-helix transcriptional regulator [Candidatus Micrarchaeota archaeon]